MRLLWWLLRWYLRQRCQRLPCALTRCWLRHADVILYTFLCAIIDAFAADADFLHFRHYAFRFSDAMPAAVLCHDVYAPLRDYAPPLMPLMMLLRHYATHAARVALPWCYDADAADALLDARARSKHCLAPQKMMLSDETCCQAAAMPASAAYFANMACLTLLLMPADFLSFAADFLIIFFAIDTLIYFLMPLLIMATYNVCRHYFRCWCWLRWYFSLYFHFFDFRQPPLMPYAADLRLITSYYLFSFWLPFRHFADADADAIYYLCHAIMIILMLIFAWW